METANELIEKIKSYQNRLSWDEYFISTALLLKRLGIKKKIYGFDTFEGFLDKKHRSTKMRFF